jgi:signal transduction histidine kinase
LAENIPSGKDAYLVIVPIHRRDAPIGVLLVECSEKDIPGNETIAFLSRLSDHAAIAISNAQLYADLQSANIAKTEFVSLVSHELKTPMTSIKGYADLLAKGAVGPINDAQSNFLNTIRSNVSRMATLVSDLSDISRIEAGRMRLEYSSLPINDSIMEVIHSAQTQVNEKKQTIELRLSDDNPNVWCDHVRLTQILTNLLSNAIKYTPNTGTITISEQQTNNLWDPKGAPEVICVQVSDTGYGISTEDQKKIFQKFFRSEDQNIREAPGTGLGLNITRHLVEMQGGRIWFESQPGKGTSFYFTIPVSSVTQ